MIEIQFSSRAKLTGHCVGNTGLDVGEYGMEADIETLATHPSISTVIIIRHIWGGGGTYAWNPYQTGNDMEMSAEFPREIYQVYQYQNSA